MTETGRSSLNSTSSVDSTTTGINQNRSVWPSCVWCSLMNALIWQLKRATYTILGEFHKRPEIFQLKLACITGISLFLRLFSFVWLIHLFTFRIKQRSKTRMERSLPLWSRCRNRHPGSFPCALQPQRPGY